jgi:hypothetical protein
MPLRSTAHSTSGRNCSHLTTPFVARSINGQRCAGIGRLPLIHCDTAWGLTPTRLARRALPPTSLHAARMGV